MVTIRDFQQGDEKYLRKIFFNTIRNININDYSPQQVTAWAPEQYDEQAWCQRITAMAPFVATIDNQVVGYSDLQPDGYIDHFFCHANYQGKGIGRSLMQHILDRANRNKLPRLYSHVSITARPFFEHMGYTVVKSQKVTIRGVVLTNHVMEKILSININHS